MIEILINLIMEVSCYIGRYVFKFFYFVINKKGEIPANDSIFTAAVGLLFVISVLTIIFFMFLQR